MLKNTKMQIILKTHFLPPTLHSVVSTLNQTKRFIFSMESFLQYLKPHTKVHKLKRAKGDIKIFFFKKRKERRLPKLFFVSWEICCHLHQRPWNLLFLKALPEFISYVCMMYSSTFRSSLLKDCTLTSLQSSFVQLVLIRVSNHLTVPSSPQERKV